MVVERRGRLDPTGAVGRMRGPMRRTAALRITSLLAGLLALAACGRAAPIDGRTIVPDDEHNDAAAENALHYEVDPSPTLVLDLRGYSIPEPAGLEGRPINAIHILANGDFRAAWDGKSVLELGAATLTCIRPAPLRFPGFIAGQQYVVGLGHDRPDGDQGQLHFDVMWAGLVDVRSGKPAR
jgi:predicted small lipoprotein YifL